MLKMKNFVIFGMVAFALALSSCKSAKKTDDEAGGIGQGDLSGADENTLGDSDSGKAMGLKTIYFPYDSSDLDAEGKEILKSNAEILKAKSSLKIQVEGHCDQRGGIQYNVALGEKRANSVKGYLKTLGVAADRIAIISYGKEKPIDSSLTDAAYSKNRRANFAVTSK
jgi:peptidoglycan-associated lipoprotein